MLTEKCWSFEFGKKMQAFPSSVRTGRQRGAQWRGSSRQTVSWRRGCDTRLRKFCKVLANTLTWYKVPGSKSWKNKPNRNMLCTALSRANTVGARGRSRNNMEQLSSLKGAWISMFRACVMIRLACRKVCLGPKLHGLYNYVKKILFGSFIFDKRLQIHSTRCIEIRLEQVSSNIKHLKGKSSSTLNLKIPGSPCNCLKKRSHSNNTTTNFQLAMSLVASYWTFGSSPPDESGDEDAKSKHLKLGNYK